MKQTRFNLHDFYTDVDDLTLGQEVIFEVRARVTGLQSETEATTRNGRPVTMLTGTTVVEMYAQEAAAKYKATAQRTEWTTYSVWFREKTRDPSLGWSLWSEKHDEQHHAEDAAKECLRGREWAETRISRNTQLQEWVTGG